jgi:hypothetical protein
VTRVGVGVDALAATQRGAGVGGTRALALDAPLRERASHAARAAVERVVREIEAATTLAEIRARLRTSTLAVHTLASVLARAAASPAVEGARVRVDARSVTEQLVDVRAHALAVEAEVARPTRVAAAPAMLGIVVRDEAPVADPAVVDDTVAVVVAAVAAALLVRVRDAATQLRLETVRRDAAPAHGVGAVQVARADLRADRGARARRETQPRDAVIERGAGLTEGARAEAAVRERVPSASTAADEPSGEQDAERDDRSLHRRSEGTRGLACEREEDEAHSCSIISWTCESQGVDRGVDLGSLEWGMCE